MGNTLYHCALWDLCFFLFLFIKYSTMIILEYIIIHLHTVLVIHIYSIAQSQLVLWEPGIIDPQQFWRFIHFALFFHLMSSMINKNICFLICFNMMHILHISTVYMYLIKCPTNLQYNYIQYSVSKNNKSHTFIQYYKTSSYLHWNTVHLLGISL